MHFNDFFPSKIVIFMRCENYDRAGGASDDNTMHARCTTKATHTLKKMFCFPRQQWLRERASILRYTYIACLVTFTTNYLIIKHFSTSSSPIGTTAHCGVWPVEHCPSHFFLSATNSLHLLTPST